MDKVTVNTTVYKYMYIYTVIFHINGKRCINYNMQGKQRLLYNNGRIAPLGSPPESIHSDHLIIYKIFTNLYIYIYKLFGIFHIDKSLNPHFAK